MRALCMHEMCSTSHNSWCVSEDSTCIFITICRKIDTGLWESDDQNFDITYSCCLFTIKKIEITLICKIMLLNNISMLLLMIKYTYLWCMCSYCNWATHSRLRYYYVAVHYPNYSSNNIIRLLLLSIPLTICCRTSCVADLMFDVRSIDYLCVFDVVYY